MTTRNYGAKSDGRKRAGKPKGATPSVSAVTPAEQAALDCWQERRAATPPIPLVQVEKQDGVNQVNVAYAGQSEGWTLLANAMGTTSQEFLAELLSQTVHVTGQGAEANAERINFMLAAMRGIGPQDEAESMLAAQMVATHMLAMKCAAGLANPSTTATVDHMNGYASRMTKLTRTFTMQMDALKRYRTGGEQKVTVQHVNVNDGGQAIVGDVTPIIMGRG